VVRNRNHATLYDPRHRPHVFGEAAAIWIEASRKAGGFKYGTLREEFSLAIEAVAAGNVMEANDPIARVEFLDTAPDRNDRSSQLVPQNLRRLDEPIVNLLDVGAADATSGYTEKNFALADVGYGNGLDNHASFAAVHTRAHVSRHGPAWIGAIDLCGKMTHFV
jgi:hypothetical protein